jgi:cyclase
MQQLTKNVYVETGTRGCNHGFVTTSQGVVMIDTPQVPSHALKLREEVAKHGPVAYLFNAEPHPDHWTENSFFEAPCIAHYGVRERILSSGIGPVMERVQTMGPAEVRLIEGYEPKPPNVTFTDELTMHVGDHTFHAIHMPGHTPYQAAILIPEEGLIFTSDNIFYQVQTFLHEGLLKEWLEALERLRKLDADVFVPGHGDVCGKGYLDEQGEFIQEWVGLVRRAKEQGMTKSDAMDKLSLLDRYPMDVGIDFMGPAVMRWNVSRLYDVIATE